MKATIKINVSHNLDGIDEYNRDEFVKDRPKLQKILNNFAKSGLYPNIKDELITMDGNMYTIVSRCISENYINYWVENS